VLPGLLAHPPDGGDAMGAIGNGTMQPPVYAPSPVYVPQLQQSVTLPPCPTMPYVSPGPGPQSATPRGAPGVLSSQPLSHQSTSGTPLHHADPRVRCQLTPAAAQLHKAAEDATQ